MCSISSAVTIAACWDVTPNTALDAYFISLYLLFLTMTLTFIVILLCDFIVLYLAFIISYHFYIYIYFSCLLSTFFPSSYILSFFSCNISFQPTHRCSPSLLFPISRLFFYLAYSSVLKLEVKCCSWMLIPVYQTVPITSHVTVIFILTAVRTSNLKCLY